MVDPPRWRMAVSPESWRTIGVLTPTPGEAQLTAASRSLTPLALLLSLRLSAARSQSCQRQAHLRLTKALRLALAWS